jgi:NTP pyrophosphatase (non-canonical NTP hydrolase)
MDDQIKLREEFELKPQLVKSRVETLVQQCHGAASASGWWNDLHTGADLRETANVGEKLMLIVSEVAEAMEADRKNLKDEHLPEYDGLTVELADALIRICDFAGALDLPLANAMADKMVYNAQRADHKPEERIKEGGKGY